VHDPSNLKSTLSTAIASHHSSTTDLAAWKRRMQTVDAVLRDTKTTLAAVRENVRAERATLVDLRGGACAMDTRTTLDAAVRKFEELASQLDDCEVDVAEWTQWVVGVGVEVRKMERRLADVERRIAEGLVLVGKVEGADEKLELIKAKF
jgi:septal ring factor EnvC (AmiA/AmiB activator)